MDQGIILAFKAHYQRHLFEHIITSAAAAMTTDNVSITALNIFCWIQAACEAITETTMRNAFKSGSFEKRLVVDEVDALHEISIADEIISIENKSIEECDRVLEHLTIGKKLMSG